MQTRILSYEKNHIKQTYTLMLNLPYFLSWAMALLLRLGVIVFEIYRKRLFEFSTLAWGQRGIILINRTKLHFNKVYLFRKASNTVDNSPIVSREFFICKYNIFDLS